MADEVCAAAKARPVVKTKKRLAIGRQLFLCMILAFALPTQRAIAQSDAETTDSSVAGAFRNICIRSGARIDAVVAASESFGFSRSPVTPAIPPGVTEVVALELGNGAEKRVIVVSVGVSSISKTVTAEVPIRTCVITAMNAATEIRRFTREWVGTSPQFDNDEITLFGYLERVGGNTSVPENDLPALIGAVNAGELRTVVVRTSGNTSALSWVVFEAPAKPLEIPVSLAAKREDDPFFPCKWEVSGKAQNSPRRLSCPDEAGEFRPVFEKGVSVETPVQARGGDVAAMLKLAVFYSDGPQPVRDPVTAFSWSKRAAEVGAPGGAFNLGLAYDDAVGTVKDKNEAQRWYRKAIEQQHTSAMVNLAVLLLDSANGSNAANIPEASGLLRRAADAGSNDAIFNMGYLAENGIGQAKDMNEALRWYRLGAEKKDTRAMQRLGLLYVDGIGGIARDEATGVDWLAQAAETMLKIVNVVNGLRASVYGFDDPKRRLNLSRAAANDPSLALTFGLYLADKKNRTRDPKEAIRLLRIAADAGIPAAALRLGVMYAEGDGTRKNNIEAIKWFRADPQLRTLGLLQRTTKFTDKPLP
jgi:TPR repeat protein